MRSASPKERREAEATRTLPWTAMRMPIWPTIRLKTAPMTKAAARARPMIRRTWDLRQPAKRCKRLGGRRNDVDGEEQGDRQDDDQGRMLRSWRRR